MTSEDALSTVGVGESSSDNKVSWPLSPAWLMNWWTFEVLITLLVFWTGILTDEGGPLALPPVDEDDEEADEPGDTVAGLTTDADDELESDWLKLLRRSSFSRVRSPSILNDFYCHHNQSNKELWFTTKIQIE